MEVHHHPDVEKKGFKEYLLEGLMIFFAVFMGFIAENIRESIAEHHKVKAYAATMISDLKMDNDSLKHEINYYSVASSNIDSLQSLLSKNKIGDIPTGKLYYYGLFGGASGYFVPNDATFQQLKSTGSLQFFEKDIAHNIEYYDELCRKMQSYEDIDKGLYVEVRKVRAQIFMFQYNSKANDIAQHSYLHGLDTAALNKFISNKPPLLTTDPVIFNQYIELVRSRFFPRMIFRLKALLKCNNKLLGDLEKEYGDK
jgi:hypothetical protein